MIRFGLHSKMVGLFEFVLVLVLAAISVSKAISQEIGNADDQLILANSEVLDRAEMLQQVFNKLYEQEDFLSALETAQRVLDIREGVFGTEHPLLIASLNNVATIHLELRQFQRAEEIYKRVAKLCKVAKGKERDYADVLSNLGFVYFETDRFEEARNAHGDSLRIQEKTLGDDHIDLAVTLSNLGETEAVLGRFADAQVHLQRAFAIRKQHFGLHHESTANTLSSIGGLYQKQGNLEAAKAVSEKVVEILTIEIGEAHERTTVARSNYASVLLEQQEYVQARPLLQRVLDEFTQRYGDQHVVTATAMNNLASCLHKLEQQNEAEALYRRCLAIRIKELGGNNTLTATTKANLARLYRDTEKFAEAETLLIEAFNAFLQNFDGQHPLVLQTLNSLAVLYASSGHEDESINKFDLVRKAVRRHAMIVLPALSDGEQLQFLKHRYFAELSGAISTAFRTDRKDVARTAAEWAINGKAVAFEALAQKNLLSRKQVTSELEKDRENLIWVRQQLANFSMKATDPKERADRIAAIAELTSAERMLARKLGYRNRNKQTAAEWVSWKSIQQSLAAETAFVDILKYKQFDFRKRQLSSGQQDERYAAWITLPDDPAGPQMLDLGPAAPIDRQVQSLLTQIESAARPTGSIAVEGESVATKQLMRTASQLSNNVWRQIANTIGESKHLIISPDSNLWLLPWACLPPPQNQDRSEDQGEGQVQSQDQHQDQFLVEEYSFTLATNARQLLSPKVSIEANKPFSVSDPDYNLPLGAKKSAIASLHQISRKIEQDAIRPAGETYLPKVKRLPFTAAEADAVLPSISSYTSQEPIVARDQTALELLVKSVRNPQVAMFSTHGFFLNDKQLPEIANPLLRCGLLFAGCNEPDSFLPSDDGVLTGLEICGLDYRGTKLVVLSACQTGLGEINDGEGVAGLRQAFQLAGAESVLASHWSVEDIETARLMKLFFNNLASGKSKPEALRQAQLARIKARRKRDGAAHPFFWAAFTLTGSD